MPWLDGTYELVSESSTAGITVGSELEIVQEATSSFPWNAPKTEADILAVGRERLATLVEKSSKDPTFEHFGVQWDPEFEWEAVDTSTKPLGPVGGEWFPKYGARYFFRGRVIAKSESTKPKEMLAGIALWPALATIAVATAGTVWGIGWTQKQVRIKQGKITADEAGESAGIGDAVVAGSSALIVVAIVALILFALSRKKG